MLYSCRAVENQKIKRERKKGRTGELEKKEEKERKKERKGEERRKRKKERQLVARGRCGQWSVSGITASGRQHDGVTSGGAVQR